MLISRKSVRGTTIYADLDGNNYISLSVIIVDGLRPGVVVTEDRVIVILDLVVGLQTGIQRETESRYDKYKNPINELSS